MFSQIAFAEQPVFKEGLLNNHEEYIWCGVGHCSGHFGEFLQGVFRTPSGVQRGLVTVPCRKIGTVARVFIQKGAGNIDVPTGKEKARRAIANYISYHNLPRDVGVNLTLESSIEEGIGMGSSTADVVASLRALYKAFGLQSSVQELADLTLVAELACDSTMFGQRPILFAQREGDVIEDFGNPLMPLAIFGFNLQPGEIFRTDETEPAKYSEADLEYFEKLRQKLRSAIKFGNTDALGKVATESAKLNQAFFPKAHFEDFLELAEDFGARGVCISHSGTIGGLIYSTEKSPDDAQYKAMVSQAHDIGIASLGPFFT